jgi:hypothetical protein
VTRKIGIGSKRLWQVELSLEVQWTRSRANIAPPAALSAASFTVNRSRVGTSFGLYTARIASLADGVQEATEEKGRTAWRYSILNLIEGRPPTVEQAGDAPLMR